MKMKNIITAIGEEEIYNILKEYKELNILYKDIQYEEGIIEAINLTQNVEIIIINNELIVNKELEKIVQEIILLISSIFSSRISILTESKFKSLYSMELILEL